MDIKEVLNDFRKAKNIEDIQKLLKKYDGTVYENVVHSLLKAELYIITLLTKIVGGRR